MPGPCPPTHVASCITSVHVFLELIRKEQARTSHDSLILCNLYAAVGDVKQTAGMVSRRAARSGGGYEGWGTSSGVGANVEAWQCGVALPVANIGGWRRELIYFDQ